MPDCAFMDPEIVKKNISPERVTELARESFDTMCKVVVDITRGVAAFGGRLHDEGLKTLLSDGSSQQDLWGANIFLDDECGPTLDYQAMINIKKGWNKSVEITHKDAREKVQEIIHKLTSGMV